MPEIRKAIRSDVGAAWDIRRQAVLAQCGRFYGEREIESWTAGTPSEKWADLMERGFYVAVENACMIATGMITIETGRLDAIFVHPNHMGQGVGKAMIDFLEGIARAHEIQELILESTLNAAPFYRRCGFTGEAVSVYHSPRGLQMDCIAMTKTLRNDVVVPS